jgi:hypothetical protein
MKIKKLKLLIDAGNELKKILSVLSNPQVSRFTLSMEIFPGDLSEPKTISVQGERSTDGGWNTSSPREQYFQPHQSLEILQEKLASIEGRVHEYIAENSLEEDWEEVEASIDGALKSGLSAEDLEYRSAVPIHALAASSYAAHFCAPLMATAYARWGAEALGKNDLSHASYYLDRGCYWSSSTMFIANPNDRFVARAGTGGHGKNLRREPVKDKVAELLVNLAPEAGWESISIAIKEVTNELIFSHSIFVEDCLLKTETLPRTIVGWVETDPERFRCSIKPKA